jgi:peptide/nickel transport system ATP-binding protein
MALLDIQGLKTHFKTDDGWLHAVDGVDISIDAGETVCVVGESGCGKSVTAKTVMKLIDMPPGKIVAGQVLWQGRDLVPLPAEEMQKIRAKEIAIIFQEPMTSLNPVYTVGEQIAESVRLHEGLSQARSAMNRAVEMLKLVNIPTPSAASSDYPHQFSGGMRQRVMIAIALACNPKLLIADEPTTALDVTIQAQILDLMQELKDRLGMAVMLITHAMGVVAEVAQKVVVMYAGKVVEEAPVGELFANPRHPYTQGLIRSIPRIDLAATHKVRLEAIPGTVPKLIEPAEGCRFRRALQVRHAGRVHTRHPPLREVGPATRWPAFLAAARDEHAAAASQEPGQAVPHPGGLLQRVVDRVHAVDGVSFDLAAGETLGVVGESGCGKSTTGRCILRLIEPTSGEVLVRRPQTSPPPARTNCARWRATCRSSSRTRTPA